MWRLGFSSSSHIVVLVEETSRVGFLLLVDSVHGIDNHGIVSKNKLPRYDYGCCLHSGNAQAVHNSLTIVTVNGAASEHRATSTA